MALNVDVVKEPRGFMKVLQFLFSICAFATTTSFSTVFSFSVKCNSTDSSPTVITEDVSYPFRLSHDSYHTDVCGNPIIVVFFGDFSSDAQFYVATGVLAFLYSILALVVYSVYDNVYQNNNLIPVGDFIVHVVLAVFWLAGSSAWADGVTQLKSIPGPSWTASQMACKMPGVECAVTNFGQFAKLHVSLILGFLNVFLFSANLWFLYKETAWFKSTEPPIPPQGTPAPAI